MLIMTRQIHLKVQISVVFCIAGCNSKLDVSNLFQVITEPTRITEHGATVLDLIIANCPGYFVHTGTLITNCDHSLIFAKLSISFIKQKCYKRFVWDFNSVNESELCNALVAANLDECISQYNDTNSLYENWFACFYNIIESHIRHNTVTIRSRDKPWMNNSIRRAIRKRNRLLKIHAKKTTRVSWEGYRLQRNLTTTFIRSSKFKYFSKLNERLQDTSIS